jgi:hypothetical protein
MPSRTTQESYRPRASDRTMVANLADRHACPFQERDDAVTIAIMKPLGWDQSLSSRRRSGTTRRQDGRMRNRTAGLDVARPTAPSGGGENCLLTSPFIGLPIRTGTLSRLVAADPSVFTHTTADLIPWGGGDDGRRRQPFLGLCNFEQPLIRIIRNSG